MCNHSIIFTTLILQGPKFNTKLYGESYLYKQTPQTGTNVSLLVICKALHRRLYRVCNREGVIYKEWKSLIVRKCDVLIGVIGLAPNV